MAPIKSPTLFLAICVQNTPLSNMLKTIPFLVRKPGNLNIQISTWGHHLNAIDQTESKPYDDHRKGNWNVRAIATDAIGTYPHFYQKFHAFPLMPGWHFTRQVRGTSLICYLAASV